MIRLIAFFIVFGVAAAAQSLPERYMVSGVAHDDVLNIRTEPRASSEKVGELGPFFRNVEVQRVLNGWGFIGAGETSGWVSMRYLSPNPFPENEVPRPMVCSGTEPYWTFAMYPHGAQYTALALDEGPRVQTIITEAVAPNGFLIQSQEGLTLKRTLMIDGRACSDGMSDRNYAMSATLFTQTADGNNVQTGCCTMQLN